MIYFNKNLLNYWRSALIFLVFLMGVGPSAWALTTSALKDQTCSGYRAGNKVTCTAGEFVATPVFSAAPGTPPFCVAGNNFNFQVELNLSGTNTDRYNIGFFVGQQGNDPGAITAGNICSVATFPKTPLPWKDADGDACGDFAGTGNQTTTVNEIKVICAGNTATGDLNIPYQVTYWQNTQGPTCTGPSDVQIGSTSKCTGGTGAVSGTIPVKVASYVDVTKATLPAGDTTQTFSYTATGPAGSKVGALVGTTYMPDNSDSAHTATNTITVNNVKAGDVVRFFINATTAGQTLTIVENTPALGWESSANAISCTSVTGTPTITTDLANRSIAANLSLTNAAATCTLTNKKSAKITLVKNVGARVAGTDQFTVSASGGGTLQGTSTVTTAGAATTASTTFYSSPGTLLTLTDAAATTTPATVLSKYDSRLTCTNAKSGTSGYTSDATLPNGMNTTSTGITPLPGDDITCTYTNTPKPKITLQKVISAAGNGRVAATDQFVLGITGTPPSSVTTTGTGSTATGTVSLDATAGTSITLTEVAAVTTPATNLANYTTTYACSNSTSGGTVVPSGTGTSITFTPAGNDVITCTFTNTRKSATLTLQKTWVSGVSGDKATVTSSGFLNNATSGLSTSSGANTTTGSPVTVYVGETGTIAEAISVGDSASYTSGLACTGNTTALSGSSLTVNAADTAIVCTFTNTKKSKITLVKTVGGRVGAGDEFTVAASGGATASVTTASPAVSATTTFYSTPGVSLTLTDTAAGATTLSNYDTRLSCTNAVSGGSYTPNTSLPTNSSTTSYNFTPAIGDDITCTYTNTPKPKISLQKVIAAGGGRVANTDQFLLSMTGATSVTTTGTGSTATGTVSLVGTAGTLITLTEAAAGTTNLANYTTTYACTNSGSGGTTVTSGTGTSFSFTPANNDVMACTFTNTRKSATLTLKKVWVNSASGNTTTVASTGFINNASSGLSTSSGSGNTTMGSAVTVYAGETGTINETFGIGSIASYGTNLVCSGNSTPLSGSTPGSTLTVNPLDTAITCTLTNTGTRITLVKNVGGRVVGTDQFTVSASGGGTLQGTSSVTTAGIATSATTTFYSNPGVLLTLTDAAAGSTTLSDYESRLNCTNATSGSSTSLPSNVSATTYGITPAIGDNITCTYTNTPKPRITLQKVIAAGGGRVANTDQFVLSMTGATSVTTTGTGSAVTSAAVSLAVTTGTPITLTEIAAVTTPATNLANYTTTYACSNSTSGGTVVPSSGTGTSITFTPVNNDVISCTFINTRKSTTLTLRKTWVAGLTGDTATVNSTGFINNATSGLSTSSGSNTTTGSPVTVYAGETGTIGETSGGVGSYTTSVTCSGNTQPLSGSSLTIDPADSALVCTLTNTGGVRITLKKTVGGRINSGDQFTVSASGGGSLQGTSSVTTVGTANASTIFYSSPGALLTLTDAAAAGSTTVLGNYDSRLSCTNAASGSSTTLPTNLSTTSHGITPAIGDDITCTYTNTPKPQISLQKVISAVGHGRVADTDQFVLTIAGATPVTTTGTGSSVTSAAVSLAATAGTSITLTEAAAVTTPATNLANYTTTYVCSNSTSGGTVVPSGTGTSITFTPAANDVIACIFTNTRKSATLALQKTWVSGVSGDTATVTSAGFINNATSGLSTSTGSNTTPAGNTVTVYAGETGSIDESFGTVAAAYTGSVACTGNNTALSGSSLTVNAADTAIVCTLTNVGGPLPNRLTPNGAQTAQPGTAVFYAHTFNASSAGQVTFTLSNSAIPTGWPWSQVLYRDSDCNGSLDAGEPNITGPIAVTASVPLCLVVKQFVPAGIASSAQNITTLSATFSYSANPAWPSSPLSVVDVTTVGEASALSLNKRVSNITQNGPIGISVNAKPGDTLQYTLTAVNNGSTPLSTLVINDATPAFTTYLSAACPVTLPAVITACNVSVQPAVGASGNVQWTFSGSLAASGQLAVTYQVKLNQ